MTISYIIIIHIVCYHQNHYVTPRVNNLPLFDDDKQFIAKVEYYWKTYLCLCEYLPSSSSSPPLSSLKRDTRYDVLY